MQLEPKRVERLQTDNFRFINTSEAVQSIDYYGKLKILEVEFVNSDDDHSTYHYLNVPKATWQELQDTIESGESLGTYINKVIKPNYDYYKLEV
ncbi:MAG: KTSC domain-containing protein [Chitinophagaceae bacterium]